jgi:hypothetical protein
MVYFTWQFSMDIHIHIYIYTHTHTHKTKDSCYGNLVKLSVYISIKPTLEQCNKKKCKPK